MKKIVITGGLGYIGTELCKIYSGYGWNDRVTVIDNRFISERVNQIRNWNMNFVHGDILDKELIKKLCKDADIVHHLAGITDVPRVKSESNTDHENKIKEIAQQGTQNILDAIDENCKIIMPSTHVVYEGLDTIKKDITEKEKTSPVLAYGKSKEFNENQLKKSNKNYVILRLGSVYGYSTDTARVDIMANFFAKTASQNGTLKLFACGRQIKSLVPLIDVARCFKFMEERTDIKNQLFNLTKETVTVKEVAQICKKYNPNVILRETNDEIPNLGFSLSNKKILNTGFKFLYALDECIKEMIQKWSNQKLIKDLEYVKDGENEYVDSRGKISNHELTEPINMIGLIHSKKGTIRANHYHPQQEQKCLFTKGQIIEIFQDILNPNSPKITQVVNEGQLSIIKPNVAHTMVFTKDTTFLNLVRGEREHENYGITHTIFHELVNEDFRDFIVNYYKAECRSCGNEQLKNAVSLGMSPLANNLLKDNKQEDEVFPLEMNYCPECHNCQLSVVVPPENMFNNYLYVSSTSSIFRKHFSDMAIKFIDDFKLDSNSLVVDIGSNDGIFLKPLQDNGVQVLGVDPAKNICDIANNNGIETIEGYFDDIITENILKNKGKADLVTGFNVFAHSDNLKEITNNAFKLLKNNGTFVVEVQYILDTIKDLTFDNIYHEHVNYWSVTSLNNFFNNLGYRIYKVEHVDTHGGSIRIYVGDKSFKLDDSVNNFLQQEKNFGLLDINTYKEFAKKVVECKINTIKKLKDIKAKNKKIVGYGSPAKATTVLNYYGISSDYIDYIIEDNELKHNHFLPGMRIPIKMKSGIEKNLPDYILILAWNFFDVIKESNRNLEQNGCVFLNIRDLQT